MDETAVSIRVLVCDDDPRFGQLLTDFLRTHADLQVIAYVQSKEELLERLKDNQAVADVLILDMHLHDAGLGGLDILMELQQAAPELKTIVLSSYDEQEAVIHALSFGKAANYITKRHYHDLPAAIRDVYNRSPGLHHSTASRVLQHLSDSREQQIRQRVTPKQIEILRMLDRGMKRKEIAAELFYTEQSINNELCKVSSLLKGTFPYLQWLRLKKHNTAEILRLARQLNLLP